MIKLGIVGSDNSHADAFSQLCNLRQGYGGYKVKGVQVTAIYGQDPKRTEEVARNGQIPTIVGKPEHMLGLVDAVLVVFRHGGLHARHALPFIQARIPTFVDKPFAIEPKHAMAMIQAARKGRTLLTSFSTLRMAEQTRRFVAQMKAWGNIRTGTIVGPATLRNDYGGLFFYGCHHSELLNGVFGYGVNNVRAVAHNGNVHATIMYGEGKLVSIQFLSNAQHLFHLSAFGDGGWGQTAVGTQGIYKFGLDLVLRMIRTGKRPLTDAQLLETVRITDAIVRSFKAGGKRVAL